MKILINNSKIVASLLALGLTVAATGCTDNDYDLSDIDATIGIGGDKLQLPTNDTESIMLDDILELNNSDLISVDENGDYTFSKDGGDVTPSHPTISKVVVQKASINNNFRVEIPVSSFVTSSSRSVASKTKLDREVVVEGKTAEFKYRGSAPYEIRELSSAKVSSDINIRVNMTNELKQAVPVFKTLTLTLPSYMKLDIKDCSPVQPDYDAVKGIVTFRNVQSTADIYINATVARLDFTGESTAESSLKLNAGSDGADGTVDLNGSANMGVSFDEVNVQGGIPTGNLYISSVMTMGPITISEATGKFDPEIALSDLGSFDINDVPDFLTDSEVCINLYNPAIDLNITSDIDVAGFVSGTLIAEDENGTEMARVAIPQMPVKPAAETRIRICKQADGIDRSLYDVVNVVPELSDILKTIPKHIRFVAEAKADATREGTITLGKQYTIAPKYSMSAPLAFDEGARIVYTDSFDGWNDDIDKLSFADGSYLELSSDIENKMPAYLIVSAYAIDVNGNEIPQNNIRVDVSNSVKASADGATAVTTPLTIQLHEVQKGALKNVDGLMFRAEAAAGEGTESIVGKTINAYKHTLTLRNIKVKLVGKIIADLN